MSLKLPRFNIAPPTAVKRIAIGGLATGGFATGMRAIGAFAIGAFAVGRFAIGRLSVRKVRIESLEVEDLRVSSQSPIEKAPLPKSGFFVTHFITAADVQRSAKFYSDVLGGELVYEGEPSIVKLANSWIIINVGGGPTDDKPETILYPPKTSREVSSFLNLRVADIASSYQDWKRRGAEFLTEPKEHESEIRCYMKDPDGYLIEVGQSTAMIDKLTKAA